MNSRSYGPAILSHYVALEDWDMVKTQCESNPRDAKRWDLILHLYATHHISKTDGAALALCLPIHGACSRSDVSHDAIDALLRAYPQGIRSKDGADSRLPLHVACASRAPANVICLLLTRYPHAASVADAHNRLPLHYLMEGGRASMDLFKTMILAAGGAHAVRYRDSEDYLPIHLACKHDNFSVPLRVIETMLRIYPESAWMETKTGHTVASLLDAQCHQRSLRLQRDCHHTSSSKLTFSTQSTTSSSTTSSSSARSSSFSSTTPVAGSFCSSSSSTFKKRRYKERKDLANRTKLASILKQTMDCESALILETKTKKKKKKKISKWNCMKNTTKGFSLPPPISWRKSKDVTAHSTMFV